MPSTKDPLLSDGLSALGSLLPSGYALSTSGLGRRGRNSETWVVVRGPARKSLTCLVLARRRVEPRDVGSIAAIAARAGRPTLVVATFLSQAVRERLRRLRIGCWDLAGNAHIALAGIDLCLDRDSKATAQGKSERRLRSLAGTMAGRIARVLVDVEPPLTLSQVAELARVDVGSAARVLAFLVAAGFALRRPRGVVEKVDWQALLCRWAHQAPLATRGTILRARCARGVPDFLSRLAPSGLLHALTGKAAFAMLAASPMPPVAVLYVDDVPDAVAQLGLHPAADEADIILVKPTDRSVYQRSREENGLRRVSPSLMVADLDEHDTVEILRWLGQHLSRWRTPAQVLLSPARVANPAGSAALQARPGGPRTKQR